MTMTKGTRVWIVAEYHEDDPTDVVQIGMHYSEKAAKASADKWALSRHGTKWTTVVFIAEVMETVQ